MKKKTNIKLNLSETEKKKLRSKKFKIGDVLDLTIEEIAMVLEIPFERAREINALGMFQKIPSIGIEFAKDLIYLGYYTLDELKPKHGAMLLKEYEDKKGFSVDPCVEDQFRLAVYFANSKDDSKRWWDFTGERKKYRLENGGKKP